MRPETLAVRSAVPQRGKSAPLRRTVRVGPGEDVDLGEILLDPGLDLGGRVRDPDGRPVEGAEVSHSAGPTVATTDAAGAFVLRHLPAGPVLLSVGAEGFLDLDGHEAEAAPGAPAVELVLRRGALLRGTLRDGDGRPLGDRWFVVRSPPAEGAAADDRGEWVDAPDTQLDGTWSTRLPPGRYVLWWEEDEPWRRLAEVTLREGEERQLPLVRRP